MAGQPNLIAFSGSIRKESFNTRLLKAAARQAEDAGASVHVIDLADYPLPLYNGDLESDEGLPGPLKALKALFVASDGMLIASPEYNSSITPLMKNTIDWLSRREGPDEPSMVAFRGKVAGLVSASPGRLGGMRGLVHLRAILGNIGVHVIPEQRAVGGANRVFNDDGEFADDDTREGVKKVVRSLVDTAARLRAS